MMELNPDECRVLGVLIEKAQTTPNQYPLTLNAVAEGASQKNNRNPVLEFDQDRALDAVNGLRAKGLLVQSEGGGRVPKYRHETTAKLGVNTREVVLLAELLLRGPQTAGELRGRASRMHPLETLEVVTATLDQLMARPEPLVRRLPPSPGTRAERFVQLLCPELHPIESQTTGVAAQASPHHPSGGPAMAERVTQLESEVATLRDVVRRLAYALGEPVTELDEAAAEPAK